MDGNLSKIIYKTQTNLFDNKQKDDDKKKEKLKTRTFRPSTASKNIKTQLTNEDKFKKFSDHSLTGWDRNDMSVVE